LSTLVTLDVLAEHLALEVVREHTKQAKGK
jgi:hypothetical protein